MGRGEVAWQEDGWGVNDEESRVGELDGMGKGEGGGAEPESRMRGTMKWGV